MSSSPLTRLAAMLGMSWLAISIGTAADPTVDALSGQWAAATIPKVQIIALGAGTYRAHVFALGDQRVEPIAVLNGTTVNNQTTFVAAPAGEVPPETPKQTPSWWPAPATSTGWSGHYVQGVLSLTKPDGQTVTLSPHPVGKPSIGFVPPAGAVVLIGTDSTQESIAAQWFKAGTAKPASWKMLPGGILECVPKSGSILSRHVVGDHRLHVEFQLPFEPEHRGQKRANSGLYLQGRYEIQILDSFGLQGIDNECGGFYKIAKPSINACAPPLAWQTYDVDFTAAVFVSGKQTAPAKVTVIHNGITIHRDQLLNSNTAHSHFKAGPTPEGIYLQDHGHPVHFRNLWVLSTANKP